MILFLMALGLLQAQELSRPMHSLVACSPKPGALMPLAGIKNVQFFFDGEKIKKPGDKTEVFIVALLANETEGLGNVILRGAQIGWEANELHILASEGRHQVLIVKMKLKERMGSEPEILAPHEATMFFSSDWTCRVIDN